MVRSRYDLVAVGSGIFGLASVYHYLRTKGSGEVVVVEERSSPGQGNTGKSVGGYRSGLFSSELNRVLSESTVSFFRHLQSSGIDIGMEQVGYLILLTEEQLRNYAELIGYLIRSGAVREIGLEELRRAMPWARFDLRGDEEAEMLGIDRIRTALFSPRSGYIDVEKLVNYYYEELVAMGVEFMFNTRAERIVVKPINSIGHPREPLAWQAKRFEGVETRKGLVEGDQLLLATGSWVGELLDPIGVEYFVKPKKRQMFAIKARGELSAFFEVDGLNEQRSVPMSFIPNGPYVVPRVRERSIWLGFSDDVGRAWGIDERPEESFYYDNIYPVVRKIFPILEGARPDSMWAGCYSVNVVDQNPVVYKVLNMTVVTGGSGSGVMKSDAVGRVAAAVLCGRKEAELYDGRRIPVDWLDVRKRKPEPELLVF